MRRILILCSLLPLIGGCLDAVGPEGDCSREMDQVRRAEGQPISTSTNEQGGNTVEIWQYPHVAYTFRWGTSYEGCEFQPNALDRVQLLQP